LAGYTRNIQNKNQEAFNRLALMIAFNYAIPGIPILYYGDEIGMPGANDPDNRRMMKFDNLNEDQQKLRGMVQSLSKMRNSQMPLLYGNTLVSHTNDYLLIIRQYPGKDIAAVFTRKGFSGKIDWPASLSQKNWKSLLHSDRSSFNEVNQTLNCQEDSFIFLTR
jgi:glycosidase